jgi:rare lipoprotein A
MARLYDILFFKPGRAALVAVLLLGALAVVCSEARGGNDSVAHARRFAVAQSSSTASADTGWAATTRPGTSRVSTGHPAIAEKRSFAQVGLASWYGGRSHGRRTASGQPFDSTALTAAHRTLPFGTVVRVTNLKTGKVVKVRVNDRGPFTSRRRIVDLSAAAGKSLDIRKHGVVPVRLEVFPSDQDRAAGDAEAAK